MSLAKIQFKPRDHFNSSLCNCDDCVQRRIKKHFRELYYFEPYGFVRKTEIHRYLTPGVQYTLNGNRVVAHVPSPVI